MGYGLLPDRGVVLDVMNCIKTLLLLFLPHHRFPWRVIVVPLPLNGHVQIISTPVEKIERNAFNGNRDIFIYTFMLTSRLEKKHVKLQYYRKKKSLEYERHCEGFMVHTGHG